MLATSLQVGADDTEGSVHDTLRSGGDAMRSLRGEIARAGGNAVADKGKNTPMSNYVDGRITVV